MPPRVQAKVPPPSGVVVSLPWPEHAWRRCSPPSAPCILTPLHAVVRRVAPSQRALPMSIIESSQGERWRKRCGSGGVSAASVSAIMDALTTNCLLLGPLLQALTLVLCAASVVDAG